MPESNLMFLFWTYFFLMMKRSMKAKAVFASVSVWGICQCVFEVRNGCSYLVVNSLIFPDFQNSVELIHWVSSNLRQFWQVMYFLTACINQEIFEESAKATKYWSWVLNLMWYFRDQCHFRSYVSRLFVCSCGCWIVLREINLLSGRRCIRAFSAPNGFAYHAKCTTSV